jgi:aspartate/methionine/tyrosine aminotransferase
MTDTEITDFITRWHASIRHDLAASESETIALSDLLAMAEAEDAARWQGLRLGYGDPRGAAWLREAVADTYQTIAADDVVCFAGAQEALGCVLRALLRPGDHAVAVVPCFQPSERALTSLCDCSGVALDPGQGWQLDLEAVAAAIRPETRLVLMNFPNNPTGTPIEPATLRALVALCRRHGLWLVNDEVYRHLDRDPVRRPPPVADAYERGVSIDGLSKGYGLPGLRVGWVACRDRALLARSEAVKHVASGFLAAPSQVLGRIALCARAPILARNRGIAEANLRLLAEFMAEFGFLFEWTAPAAGVVCFPRYLGEDGVESFAVRLARDAATLVLPASAWRSTLAPVCRDRLRIGFGRAGFAEGLAALRRFLTAGVYSGGEA